MGGVVWAVGRLTEAVARRSSRRASHSPQLRTRSFDLPRRPRARIRPAPSLRVAVWLKLLSPLLLKSCCSWWSQ